MIVWKYFLDTHKIAQKIRLGWKSIAVRRWNHIELAPGWNLAPVFKTEVKSPRGEISTHIERAATYESLLIDRGISPRGEISRVTGL